MTSFMARSNLSEKMLALGKAHPEYAEPCERFANDLDDALVAHAMDPSPVRAMKLVEEWIWLGKLYKSITGNAMQAD
jgi:hypothetical protein